MIIQLFGIGQKSKSVTVSAQRHLNLYAEVAADVDKAILAFYGTPGCTLFTTFGDTPIRGGIAVGDFLYVMHRNTFYEINNAGVATARGTIGTSSNRVEMSYNGLQIGIVDGLQMYMYALNRTAQTISSITRVGTLATLTTASPHNRYTSETVTVSGATPAAYNGTFAITVTGPNTFTYVMASDPGGSAAPVGSYVIASSFVIVTSGLMANPTDITYQDHFFIAGFADSGIFQLSSIDDGTTWDALDFASAESDPDNLVRCIADHGEIVLCGTNTIEFWGNTGALDFPYANQRGSTLEYGLAAPLSLVKYNDSLAGLMKNKMGQVQVMMLQGHALRKISTVDVDFIINEYSSVADATAFSYMLAGHPMYEINFPTAAKSWLYDMSSNLWTELESGLTGGRHIAEICIDYLNNPRITDYMNGNIYTMDVNVFTDNGTPIVREIQARHFFKDYIKMRVSKLQVDFETGVGLTLGQGMNPQVMLQISRDNGHTWGNEIWVTLGFIGKYLTRAIWWRLGYARDFVFKLRITDPVKVVIAGASVVAVPADEQ